MTDHEKFMRICENIKSTENDKTYEFYDDYEPDAKFVDSTEGLLTEEEFVEWIRRHRNGKET